jgi:hypothetical protein
MNMNIFQGPRNFLGLNLGYNSYPMYPISMFSIVTYGQNGYNMLLPNYIQETIGKILPHGFVLLSNRFAMLIFLHVASTFSLDGN